MMPFLVSLNATAFIGVRPRKQLFAGRVTILAGPTATRTEHVCLRVRDTEEEALEDARRDAAALLTMWRQQVERPKLRP